MSEERKLSREEKLADLAVRRSYVTVGQMRQCIEEILKLEQQGNKIALVDLLLQKQLITSVQAQALQRQIETEGRFPILGGFEILEKIGEGGMGAVYKARQLSLDRIVAVKVLPKKLATDKEFLARFLSEARAAAQLNNPNIVQCYEAGEAEGRYFMAIEYVAGCNAGNLIDDRGRIDPLETLGICIQISRALQHAWEHRIVHRDVKPANMLYSPDKMQKGVFAGICGPAKLADLGLARVIDKEAGHITASGKAIGTPYYISPEMARGKTEADPRCDIYSLGASLYHMLTGKTPYSGETPASVMVQHLTAPVPDPSRLLPDLGKDICAIVLRAMAKSPEDRFQSHAEMAEQMEQVMLQHRQKHSSDVMLAELVSDEYESPPAEDEGSDYVVAEVVDESEPEHEPYADEPYEPEPEVDAPEPNEAHVQEDSFEHEGAYEPEDVHAPEDAHEQVAANEQGIPAAPEPDDEAPVGDDQDAPSGDLRATGSKSVLDRLKRSKALERDAGAEARSVQQSPSSDPQPHRGSKRRRPKPSSSRKFGGVIDSNIIASVGGKSHKEDLEAHVIELADGQDVSVGRDAGYSVIAIPDPRTSRRHCELRRQGDVVYVMDCGSRNGTFLNGKRLEGKTPAREGDVIVIGRSSLKIRFI